MAALIFCALNICTFNKEALSGEVQSIDERIVQRTKHLLEVIKASIREGFKCSGQGSNTACYIENRDEFSSDG